MLVSISIENFAIIDKLALNFAQGLNIFTGETGAGKSIIIEALGFVLGERGDSGLIKEGCSKMTVSAVFDAAFLPQSLKTKYKIAAKEFTLKREMDAKGKNKAWINADIVLVSDLAVIGEGLIDFHGQHEHQALFKPAEHLALLDNFAGLQKDLQAFAAVYKQKQDIENKINALKMSETEKERLLSLYQYQLEEIEKVNPKPEEDKDLENSLPKLKNAGRLKSHSAEAYTLLSSMDNSASELVAKAAKLLAEMSNADANLQTAAQELQNALNIIDDIAQTMSAYSEDIDLDPSSLDNMLGRQEALRKLKQKYGPSLEDVFTTKETLTVNINNLQTNSDLLGKLQNDLDIVQKQLQKMADGLTEKREKAAGKLSAMLIKEISPLGFGSVRFAVDMQKEEAPGPKGQDRAEFLFSSNAGQSLKPLRNIASGGEASRLMLGLKTVLAGGTPIMVFDEIDAGISGLTGTLVGAKLKQVSLGRQVLCVTHLAQVAVYGDANFSVSKKTEHNSTKVGITKLEGVAKVQEIARMIGSINDAASAGYSHARELLKQAGSKF